MLDPPTILKRQLVYVQGLYRGCTPGLFKRKSTQLVECISAYCYKIVIVFMTSGRDLLRVFLRVSIGVFH